MRALYLKTNNQEKDTLIGVYEDENAARREMMRMLEDWGTYMAPVWGMSVADNGDTTYDYGSWHQFFITRKGD